MSKSCFNRVSACLILIHLVVPSAYGAERELCRGTRPVAPLSIFYSEKLTPVPNGTPLDAAFRSEQQQVENLRKKARLAFLTRPPVELATAMRDYTFLIPETARDMYGMGALVGFSDISSAVKFQKQLWRVFVEEFSSVKEAPSETPDALRFEVTLDLSYFCRFKQKVSDLLTSRSAKP